MTSGVEILIVLALVILVFGAGWLPKAARNLGKAKVEMEKASEQFHEAKNSVVESTGVKELESTLRKADKALKTSPKNLMKDAAKGAATGGAAKKTAATKADEDNADDAIEDAEIVETPADAESNDTNINVDFD